MKHICKTAVALLAAAALLLSLAACTSSGGTDSAVLQGIFEKLQTNQEYTDWKNNFSSTTFEEKLDGGKILISAQGDEYVNGDFVFTLKGDYLVGKATNVDFMTYTFMTFLKSAVADYYGMNNTLMSGYLTGLANLGKENKFFITKESKNKAEYKLYVAGAWDMQGIDEMYVNDAAVAMVSPLGEEENPMYFNSGKVTVSTFGSAENFEMVVGEYGENTALSYQSILTVVKALQPKEYEAFIDSFTELKEVSGDGYTVSFGIPTEVSENQTFNEVTGYSYVTVSFVPGSTAVSADSSSAAASSTDG